MYQAIEMESDNSHQQSAMSKILFINLADDGDLGIKSTNALRKNPTNEVTCIQLLHFAKLYKENNGVDYILPNELLALDVNTYDQLIIGIHGFENDRHNGYCLDHQEERQYLPLFDAKQLAEIIEYILQKTNYNPEKKLLITLSMCYGGRINNYENCYQENLETEVFYTSFAYQLITFFSEQYYIELSAYTGAVGFDAIDGKLWVETEEQISIRNKIQKIEAKKTIVMEKLIAEPENQQNHEEEYNRYLEKEEQLTLKISEHFYNHGQILFIRNRCAPTAIEINLDKRLAVDDPFTSNLSYNDESSELSCLQSCIAFK